MFANSLQAVMLAVLAVVMVCGMTMAAYFSALVAGSERPRTRAQTVKAAHYSAGAALGGALVIAAAAFFILIASR